jgi:hypothetical protein
MKRKGKSGFGFFCDIGLEERRQATKNRNSTAGAANETPAVQRQR